MIDIAEVRLEAAQKLGADVVVNSLRRGPRAVIDELTGGLGADVVIEAVGTPGTFELCVSPVRAGGHVANVGVHGAAASLHLEDIWIKDLTVTTGLVDTCSTPTLADLVASGRIDTSALITLRFVLDRFDEAYDVFSRAADTAALKVLLTHS